jgi:hypothetical protein
MQARAPVDVARVIVRVEIGIERNGCCIALDGKTTPLPTRLSRNDLTALSPVTETSSPSGCVTWPDGGPVV